VIYGRDDRDGRYNRWLTPVPMREPVPQA
jgi:hypothetical protein